MPARLEDAAARRQRTVPTAETPEDGICQAASKPVATVVQARPRWPKWATLLPGEVPDGASMLVAYRFCFGAMSESAGRPVLSSMERPLHGMQRAVYPAPRPAGSASDGGDHSVRTRRLDPPYAKVGACWLVAGRPLAAATVTGAAPGGAAAADQREACQSPPSFSTARSRSGEAATLTRRSVTPGTTTLARTLAATLLAAAIVAGGSSAPAGAATHAEPAVLTASFSVAGRLAAVAATSATNAWAVGSTGSLLSPKPLIAHWNGSRWKQTPSPSRPRGELSAVAATSARNAWAVGDTSSGQSLILHWNGKTWKRVASAGAAGSLAGVGATSATNAWAVGSESGKTLILRWNGKVWKRVPSPSPKGRTYLNAVAVTSGRNAWAVGEVVTSTFSMASVILHWNGKTWKRVPSPSPSYGKYGNALAGVAATSAGNAWAVGCTDGCPVGGTPQIERWHGTSWKQVAAPTTPYALYNLAAVAASSATSAWAVGGGGPVTSEAAATAHWNGHRWTLSHARSGAGLTGVAAISARNAWAVGGTASGHTLILHWNGTTWS